MIRVFACNVAYSLLSTHKKKKRETHKSRGSMDISRSTPDGHNMTALKLDLSKAGELHVKLLGETTFFDLGFDVIHIW